MPSLNPSYRIGLRALMNALATRSIILLAAGWSTAALTLSCRGPDGPVDGEKAYVHVAKMVSFGPRPPGSPALARCGDYIATELEKIGLQPQQQKWKQSVEVYGKHTEVVLRNIWTQVPGEDPENGPVLLLAAHYDTKLCQGHPKPEQNFDFVGSIDGGGASGVLLELARVLQARQAGQGAAKPLGANIWLAWFDGEECLEFDWDNEKALLGSRHFAQTMGKDKQRFPHGLAARMRAMVLMDLIGDRQIKIDRDTHSNGTLLEIFGRAAAAMGERDRMYAYESPMTDDHVPFKNLGVAVADLIDFRWRTPIEWQQPAKYWSQQGVVKPAEGSYAIWWHTPQDTMEQVSANSLAFVGNLVWHALPEIEKALYAP